MSASARVIHTGSMGPSGETHPPAILPVMDLAGPFRPAGSSGPWGSSPITLAGCELQLSCLSSPLLAWLPLAPSPRTSPG